MEEIYISKKGLHKLKKELENLQKEKQQTAQEIKEAMEQGDLRENVGYLAAKEKQSILLKKIAEVEKKIATAKVIDEERIDRSKIRIGATVTIQELSCQETNSYTLVCPEEADPAEGKISINSPLAQSLLGAKQGDEITVSLPKGIKKFRIVTIAYG